MAEEVQEDAKERESDRRSEAIINSSFNKTVGFDWRSLGHIKTFLLAGNPSLIKPPEDGCCRDG